MRGESSPILTHNFRSGICLAEWGSRIRLDIDGILIGPGYAKVRKIYVMRNLAISQLLFNQKIGGLDIHVLDEMVMDKEDGVCETRKELAYRFPHTPKRVMISRTARKLFVQVNVAL